MQDSSHHFDTIKLIAVHGGSQAQRWAWQCPIYHQHWRGDRHAFEQLSRRPGQSLRSSRHYRGAKQFQRRSVVVGYYGVSWICSTVITGIRRDLAGQRGVCNAQ